MTKEKVLLLECVAPPLGSCPEQQKINPQIEFEFHQL